MCSEKNVAEKFMEQKINHFNDNYLSGNYFHNDQFNTSFFSNAPMSKQNSVNEVEQFYNVYGEATRNCNNLNGDLQNDLSNSIIHMQKEYNKLNYLYTNTTMETNTNMTNFKKNVAKMDKDFHSEYTTSKPDNKYFKRNLSKRMTSHNRCNPYYNPKEFNVDLSVIPVVKQQTFNESLKVHNKNEEKQKSAKYDIKTKYYNPINNKFEETILEKRRQKRKHQINWLAKEAIEKEAEFLQKKGYDKKNTKEKYGW